MRSPGLSILFRALSDIPPEIRETMPDDTWNMVIEINLQTDRGAAIIAAAAIDDLLTNLLKKRLILDARLEASLFGGQGPLRSFGSKIDMGRATGLYSEHSSLDLHTIRVIRNEFAHAGSPRDFMSQRIAALCNNLTTFMMLFEASDKVGVTITEDIIDKSTTLPKDRFLLTALHFFAMFRAIDIGIPKLSQFIFPPESVTMISRS